MRRADREVRRPMEAREKAADRRKEEVKRRIARGDTQPRPLPAIREYSMASMESMPSIESEPSVDYASGLSAEEASSGGA